MVTKPKLKVPDQSPRGIPALLSCSAALFRVLFEARWLRAALGLLLWLALGNGVLLSLARVGRVRASRLGLVCAHGARPVVCVKQALLQRRSQIWSGLLFMHRREPRALALGLLLDQRKDP